MFRFIPATARLAARTSAPILSRSLLLSKTLQHTAAPSLSMVLLRQLQSGATTTEQASNKHNSVLTNRTFHSSQPLGIGSGMKSGSSIHPKSKSIECDPAKDDFSLPHPVWSEKEVYGVSITHRAAEKVLDKVAYASVQTLRFVFDLFTGYIGIGKLDEKAYLRRFIFLETVAGVPGMVGGMVRHLNSLRRMKRDYGWIHTLLEEAENERMHLLTFLEYRQPSAMFRATVLLGQGVMFNSFLLAYMISPQFCHRFVGYLEEEAVKTYTRAVNDIDAGKLPSWEKMPVPAIGRKYWQLAED
eukprot:CAMPEP_0113899006 /NCGR_PEP_ID=MMETSP0780_2-20120614/19745_1 /TAXON_ID=652834 /ORGANISM="Palpitomonas bilix" /LENGTH=299 /DNA_ID=CAMNT_0000891033 /DNA_START=74 /DNA_END=970 /DNA_ORIENTATION=- /assembly_acc=CAM_ASM_000599